VRHNWLVRLALVVAVGGLLFGVSAGALWDPHEVTVAELSRRIALNLLGGKSLFIPHADNSLPIRADLGRGELPFTSAALGLRLFGLSAWAGRLPLALWALAGLASLYAALSRIWERRVASYAVLVLATTPLYFLQARTLLGDGVTLATFTMAWSGLAVACLSPRASLRTRAAFGLLGLLGLYAGFWCRGPIVNVAVPALAVGLPALVQRAPAPGVRLVAAASTLIGLLALALGLLGLSLAAQTGEYSVFVGSALVASSELSTFDAPLGQLAHAAFPWSALAPLALAVLGRRGDDGSAERAAVNAASLGLGLGLGAAAWLSQSLGLAILPSAACFAVLVAVGLRQLEKGELSSPLLGLVVAALGLVIGFDLRESPEKSLSAFALTAAQLPESLHGFAGWLWLGSAASIALVVTACFYERDADGARAASFQRAEYLRVLTTLQQVWQGNLLFGALLMEAALVGFLVLSGISERLVPLPQLDGFSMFWRKLVALGAILVPLAPLAPLAAMLVRDLTRALFRRAPAEDAEDGANASAPTRAQGVLLALTLLGAAASLAFYPALARQVSPKEAFERYHQLARGSEPLGVLGEQSGAARYQGVPEAEAFDAVPAAFEWLTAEPSRARRFLVVHGADLPELNAAFREQHRHNLPVLDARSSEVLLVSNQLGRGERDESPLAGLVLDAPPQLQHPVHAVLGDQLEVLGWSVQSPDGQPQTAVAPTSHYRFIIYYRVLQPLSGAWQTFVHLDGLQRRFNADHEPLGGKYPLRLWRQNDVIADATDLFLEPNFSPGPYRVYFGLFSGDRRLSVSEGPESEDRIEAGTLQVR
jgi:hypothetical protein